MIKLGSKVKDSVTGLVGVAICRVEYLNGCIQYGVKPPVKNGKMFVAEYIDEGQLEVIPEKKPAKKKKIISSYVPVRRYGGPSTDAPEGAPDTPNDNYDGMADCDNWAPL